MCRRIHLAFALSFLLIALAPAQGKASNSTTGAAVRVAHYAHMPFRETAFADLRGIYSMTEAESRTRKHYRFVYDASDRPIEVSFRLGDRIQDLNISRNAVTFTPVTRIRYEDGREIRTFFDRWMNPALANGVYREIYELDDDGNRASLHFFDADGERIESSWGIYSYEWSVDRRGTVTENRFDRDREPVSIRPHFPFYCLKLHYDQRGLLALMENYGLQCEQLTLNDMNGAQDKLQYSAQGGAYAWNVYDADEKRAIGNGPMVARGIMERDASGHTRREFYEDTDGNIMTNAYGWTNTIADFDDHGNMIERFNHDASGERINNPQLGYSGYVMVFDANGEHRESLEYRDANGEPATHAIRGYHTVKNEYDDAGNRRWSRFEDADGNLVVRSDYCAAVFEYAYDDRNRLESMRLLDEDLQAAQHCTEGWHETTYHYHPAGPLQRTEKH